MLPDVRIRLPHTFVDLERRKAANGACALIDVLDAALGRVGQQYAERNDGLVIPAVIRAGAEILTTDVNAEHETHLHVNRKMETEKKETGGGACGRFAAGNCAGEPRPDWNR